MMCVILTNFLLNHFILFTANRDRCQVAFFGVSLFFVFLTVSLRIRIRDECMYLKNRSNVRYQNVVLYCVTLRCSLGNFNTIGFQCDRSHICSITPAVQCAKRALSMEFRSFYSFLDIDFPFIEFGNQCQILAIV